MTIDFTSFARVLEETGYFHNYLTFGDGNLRSWDWDRAGRMLNGKARLAWDALLCGKAVSRAQLEKVLSKKVVRGLLDRRLCSASGSKLSFGENSLVTSQGFYFFVNRVSLAQGYYGDDARILMGLRPALAKGRVLCLNSGTGSEALGLAAGLGVELDVEADPSMQPYIATNLELNGLAGRSRVLDLSDSRSASSYDVIMARVPGLLEFGGIKFPALAGAGDKGRGSWNALLERARRDLSEDGRVVFIGLFYGTKESSLTARQLKEMFSAHKLSASINISSKLALELGVPIFNQMIATAELSSKKPRMELLETLQKEIETLGYSHAYLLKGMAWRARKEVPGTILDLSDHYYGTWLT